MLAERPCRDERLQLGHELAVTAEREVGIDAGLERRGPALVESRDLRLRPGLELQVGERLAAEQCPGLPEACGRLFGCSPRRGLHERVEAVDVELTRRDNQLVTALACDQAPVTERLAQLRDVDLDALQRRLGRLAVPDLLDQTVGRDRPATAE